MAKDLRGFIRDLEEKSPENVARIKKPVSPRQRSGKRAGSDSRGQGASTPKWVSMRPNP